MQGHLGRLSPATATIPGMGRAMGAQHWLFPIFGDTTDRLAAQTPSEDMSAVSPELHPAGCPPSFSLSPPPRPALPVPALIPVLIL